MNEERFVLTDEVWVRLAPHLPGKQGDADATGKDIINGGGKVFYYAGEDSYYLLQSPLKQLGMEECKDLFVHCGREGLFAKPNEFYDKIAEVLNTVQLDAIFL